MTTGDFKALENAADSKFELIEFKLRRQIKGQDIVGSYGVNVVKVREVVRMPKINPLNSSVRGMAGVFELRGVAIPVINLASVLGDDNVEVRNDQKIIVTEFGAKRAGFIVDETHRIRRLDWKDVMQPSSDAGSYITAMTLIENNEFLFILDLERILFDLDTTAANHGAMGSQQFAVPGQWKDMMQGMMQDMMQSSMPSKSGINLKSSSEESGGGNGPQILLVDDSSFILKNTKNGLVRAGYRVFTADNGRAAWDIVEKVSEGTWQYGKLDAVVTDVEMPQMDGFTLTKKIRELPQFADMPVLIHSSLSARSSQDAGIALGANGYIVKNDIKNLVEALREIIGWTPNKASA
jgi:two-component system chemotaxis response regulator CheV